MSWGEIKYSINSTLGTDDFVPLDEMIKNSNYLTASDSVLKVLDDVPNTLEHTWSGRINIRGAMRLSMRGYETNNQVGARIYINQQLVKTLPMPAPTDVNPVKITRQIDFNVEKGDLLEITGYSSSNDWDYDFKLCGTIMPAPYDGIFI